MATLDWISKRKYGWVMCDTVTQIDTLFTYTCVSRDCAKKSVVILMLLAKWPLWPPSLPLCECPVSCRQNSLYNFQFSTRRCDDVFFKLVSSFPISLSILQVQHLPVGHPQMGQQLGCKKGVSSKSPIPSFQQQLQAATSCTTPNSWRTTMISLWATTAARLAPQLWQLSTATVAVPRRPTRTKCRWFRTSPTLWKW